MHGLQSRTQPSFNVVSKCDCLLMSSVVSLTNVKLELQPVISAPFPQPRSHFTIIDSGSTLWYMYSPIYVAIRRSIENYCANVSYLAGMCFSSGQPDLTHRRSLRLRFRSTSCRRHLQLELSLVFENTRHPRLSGVGMYVSFCEAIGGSPRIVTFGGGAVITLSGSEYLMQHTTISGRCKDRGIASLISPYPSGMDVRDD
jgi:hypothetical protein